MLSTVLTFIFILDTTSLFIPRDPREGPPIASFYNPPVYPVVPIRIGERRRLTHTVMTCLTVTIIVGHNHYQVVTTTIMGASCPASFGPGCPPSATGHRRRIMWNTNSLQLSDISIQTGVLCTLSDPDL